MRPLRRSLPGGLYEITTRVANGQLLATPTREIHDLILGVAGHAMRAHEVKLHAFVFMSNHYHVNHCESVEQGRAEPLVGCQMAARGP